MNLQFRVVLKQLGLLLIALSVIIVLMGVFAFFHEYSAQGSDYADVKALALTAFLGLISGGVLIGAGRPMDRTFGYREAFLLVALSWILGAGISALPFRFWAAFTAEPTAFEAFSDCYFEAMSGLTTTGATVVERLGTLPASLLLWRSVTHWLGGLGIIVLFVAVLPMLGVGGRRLFRIEAPGPTPEGVRPRIQDTARALLKIYLGLTILEIIALCLCGMSLFESVCHTFATLATGGFSTQDSSMFQVSAATQIVVIIFMLLAGINFSLYYNFFWGDRTAFRKDPEFRVYLGVILVATIVITACLMLYPPPDTTASLPAAALDATFQVVAIQTTTGFCSADFDTWPFLAKAILLVLMFIGGSAGSTGGGIKVVRIMIAVKVLIAEFEHAYRPKVVRPVKIGRGAVDSDLKLNTLVYVIGILGLFVLGTVVLMLLETQLDITTAATASIATLNNIGPGLAAVGATQNYAWFTASSKLVMCVLMLLGRLEMFTVIVLFTPRFWRGE